MYIIYIYIDIGTPHIHVHIHTCIYHADDLAKELSHRTCAGSPGPVAQATVIPTAAGICEEMRWDEDGWPLSRTRFAYLASRLILERDGIATKIHKNWQCLMGLMMINRTHLICKLVDVGCPFCTPGRSTHPLFFP